MKVLVVDDEKLLLEIWQNLFAMLEIETRVASGGHAALALLRQETFDLVITDVRMPDGDGFVVLEHLRKEAGRRVATFVCSGYIDDEKTVLSPYEIERIIRKPFSFGEELEYFRGFRRG